MSDRIGAAMAAEVGTERHLYAGHPAAMVLADHDVVRWSRYGTLAHCTCGAAASCTAAGNDYAAHLAETLDRAGLLASRGVAALDRALAAAQDWIGDERVAAEQRAGGGDAETVTGDPAYMAALDCWSAASEALKAMRERMLDRAGLLKETTA